MITFGYTNKATSIVRGLCAIGAGVVFLAIPDQALSLIVKILGAFLVASGVASLFFGYKSRKEGGQTLLSVNAVIDIVLGLLLYFFSSSVVNFVFIFIGILLIILGIFVLVILFSMGGVIGVGALLFILPAVAVICGIVMLFSSMSQHTLMIVAGVALIVYGLSEFLTAWKMKKAIEIRDRGFSTDATADKKVSGSDFSDAKDVEYEKLDDIR